MNYQQMSLTIDLFSKYRIHRSVVLRIDKRLKFSVVFTISAANHCRSNLDDVFSCTDKIFGNRILTGGLVIILQETFCWMVQKFISNKMIMVKSFVLITECVAVQHIRFEVTKDRCYCWQHSYYLCRKHVN
jgi:hypothetical protein